MHRSHWDVEVYAKDFRDRRMQEAARWRRIDEAMGAHSALDNPLNAGIARLLVSARAWLSSNRKSRSAPTLREAVADSDANMRPETIVETGRQAPQPSPSRLSQPYADMMVIARGPAVQAQATEQPRVSSDC